MKSFKVDFPFKLFGGKFTNWIDVIETEWTQTPANMEMITIFKVTDNSIIIV